MYDYCKGYLWWAMLLFTYSPVFKQEVALEWKLAISLYTEENVNATFIQM